VVGFLGQSNLQYVLFNKIEKELPTVAIGLNNANFTEDKYLSCYGNIVDTVHCVLKSNSQ
jgi:hypothetical protein